MTLFGQEIAAGEKRYFSVDAGSYANRAEIPMPVIALRGARPGPTLWITGTVHGEELNGSAAAWEVIRELAPADLAGTLIVTPIANPLAYADRVKISQIDYLDMDTAFPGTTTGTWTQRIAHLLYTEIKKHADALLSFHALAPRHLAKPYTVSKLVPGTGAVPETVARARQLALAFGVEANCSVDLSTASGELPGVMSGALDITCIADGIPAFMAEMGCSSLLESESIEAAKRGVYNVMKVLGMFAGSVRRCENQLLITKRKFIRADRGGLVRAVHGAPGDILKAGCLLAETHFFGEEVERVHLAEDCYVIAARRHPVIHTGERYAFVGTSWERADTAFLDS